MIDQGQDTCIACLKNDRALLRVLTSFAQNYGLRGTTDTGALLYSSYGVRDLSKEKEKKKGSTTYIWENQRLTTDHTGGRTGAYATLLYYTAGREVTVRTGKPETRTTQEHGSTVPTAQLSTVQYTLAE